MSLRNLMAVVCLAGAFAASTAQADPGDNPITHPGRVEAFSVNTYDIDFKGGVYAELTLVGDGDTDLDLFIYDENGNYIGSGETYSDEEVVGWTPRWTGTFTVEVHNLGNLYNDYDLSSNY
jgi:hypothetical protein